jgi:hypothetical protein
MNELNTQLFRMVVATLNKQSYTEVIQDDATFYQMSRDNGLTGLIFPSLQKPSVSPEIFQKFQRDYYQYKSRDVVQTMAIQEIEDLFAAKGIRHLFLKGSFLKTVYPESYMRAMGDIDVLVDPRNLKPIQGIFKTAGYKLYAEGSTHDVYTKGKELIVEAHPALEFNLGKETDDLFADIWKKVTWSETHQSLMAPELQMMHLICHLAKHLGSSGIGIRQVLDIGIYARFAKDKLNPEILGKMLEDTRLERFYQTIIWLNDKWFGFPPVSPIDYPKDFTPRFLDQLTNFITASGVHGKAEGFNDMLPGITKQAKNGKYVRSSKLRYLFHTLFLPYADMKNGRPYLEKHKWLLPFAWVSRWCNLLFVKTRRSLRKLKKLHVDNKVIAEQAELYRKMGL